MIFITQRLDLGYTRVAGFCGYNSETKNFDELTPRTIKELIKQKNLKGLLLNKEDDIILDKEGFNQMNLMIKSAVGKYRTLLPTSSIINLSYTVVRVIETEDGKLYETVNNRCGRVKIKPERLKMLMQVGLVAGVRFNESGEIEICDGVEIEGQQAENVIEPVEKTEAVKNEVNSSSEEKSLIETAIDQNFEGQTPEQESKEETKANNDSKENSSMNAIFTELNVNSIQEESTEAAEKLDEEKSETTEVVETQKPDGVDAKISDKSKSTSRNSKKK